MAAITLPYIAMAASAAGAAAAAYSAHKQGKMQKAQADYNSAVAKRNQKLANQAAERKELQRDEDLRRERARIDKHKSSQTVSLLKSGVTLEGSPLLALAESEVLGRQSLGDIEYARNMEAWELREKGTMFGSESELATWRGKEYESAGKLKITGSLLSGTSKFVKQYGTLQAQKKKGAFA